MLTSLMLELFWAEIITGNVQRDAAIAEVVHTAVTWPGAEDGNAEDLAG